MHPIASIRIASTRMHTLTAAALLSVGVLVGAAAPALAQPIDTLGMGSRSIAMGGAVTADVQDFTANYYNPAGLARAGAARVGVGYFGAFHEMQVNGQDSNIDPVRGLVLGLVVPGQIGDVRFAFGLAMHLNDDYLSRSRSLPSRRPRWELYDNRPRRTYLGANLAIRPFPWLTIGGGISFLSYSNNTLTARGSLDVISPERRSRLEHEIRTDLLTIRYPQAGIQVQPIPEVSIGLVYRGAFALDNTLVANVGCDDSSDPSCTTPLSFTGIGAPFPGYFNLLTQSVNAYVPQQVSLGGSWDITPDFRMNAEVTWVNWSSYISPVGTSAIRLVIDVPPSLVDLVRVPSEIAGSVPIPANFQDRFVPRLGAEGVALREPGVALRVRGGAFYENSPAPSQTEFTNLIDTDRWAFSAGAGLHLDQLRPFLPGFLDFDVHFQYAYFPERTMRKTSLVDPIGDYRAAGHGFAGGLTMEVGFE